MATLKSTITKRPTGSNLSLEPTSSSKPDDRSSSPQSDSCNDSGQRTVDIGLGATVGVLGSALIAGGIAYASQNWRDNRRLDRRENKGNDWGNDDFGRRNGPGGGDGPDEYIMYRVGRSPRSASRNRRDGDSGGGDDWRGDGSPGEGKGPSKSYKPKRDKDRTGFQAPKDGMSSRKDHRRWQSSDTDENFPPKDSPAMTQKRNTETRSYKMKRNVEKEKSQELKRDYSEMDRDRSWNRGKRPKRRFVIKSLPKRSTKLKRQILVATGFTESSRRSVLSLNERSRRRRRPEVTKSPPRRPGKRRSSSSSSSSSPGRKRVRPVVPRNPNKGPGGHTFSSSSSSPSPGPSHRRSRLQQSTASRNARTKASEVQIVQIRPHSQRPTSRDHRPRVQDIPMERTRSHSQMRPHSWSSISRSSATGSRSLSPSSRTRVPDVLIEQIRPCDRNPTPKVPRPKVQDIQMEQVSAYSHLRLHSQGPTSRHTSNGSRSPSPKTRVQEMPMEQIRSYNQMRPHNQSLFSGSSSTESRSLSPQSGKGKEEVKEISPSRPRRQSRLWQSDGGWSDFHVEEKRVVAHHKLPMPSRERVRTRIQS